MLSLYVRLVNSGNKVAVKMAIIITPNVYLDEYLDTTFSVLVFRSVAVYTNSNILFTVESL